MWYAMFSYNLEYAEHSHYISGATHVYRDVLYFIFYFAEFNLQMQQNSD